MARTEFERFSATKRELLKTLETAQEMRLCAVDDLLPEPILFGRRRWRERRRAAVATLRHEHARLWAAIVSAHDVDELDALLGDVQGPTEAARRAIEEGVSQPRPKSHMPTVTVLRR